MAESKSNEAISITAGKTPTLNRQIKDSVFSDLFSDKKNLLALYRALHPEDDAATEGDIDNVTMKNSPDGKSVQRFGLYHTREATFVG